MLKFTKEELESVIDYYLSQSPSATVKFSQKVYVENVLGITHDVWDVHASDGRWWVITNPTNLYSQDQFPNMDLAITFHVGLCLRIPRAANQQEEGRYVHAFNVITDTVSSCKDSLASAHNTDDFRGIGVRCREALLKFVEVVQLQCEWPEKGRPQKANFIAWIDLIFDTFQAGSDNKERRGLTKSTLKECWTYCNWLTHSKSAKWIDAEAAVSLLEFSLERATIVVLRAIKKVPDECPNCKSHALRPVTFTYDEPSEESSIYEMPVCEECGWEGEAVKSDEPLSFNEDQFVEKDGANGEACSIMVNPLYNLARP